MHNIEQVIRRLRLSGSGMPMTPGETRMLFIHLIQKIESLENEISLCGPETDRKSGQTVSSPRPKLRGRKQSEPSTASSSPSGGKGVDPKA